MVWITWKGVASLFRTFLSPVLPSLEWTPMSSFPVIDCIWNVMAHAQKTDFFFRRNGRVPFKSAGASVQSTTGNRGVRISHSNVDYTTFRGSVKSTGYPLHSLVSPSLPLPCVTVCHHISVGLYSGWSMILTAHFHPVSMLWISLRLHPAVHRGQAPFSIYIFKSLFFL
jgi:hypothetical protein